jgi:predicted transcriptional regulator
MPYDIGAMADESGLYVRFPDGLLDRLRREAETQDRSQAQIVRRALAQYLDRLDKRRTTE